MKLMKFPAILLILILPIMALSGGGDREDDSIFRMDQMGTTAGNITRNLTAVVGYSDTVSNKPVFDIFAWSGECKIEIDLFSGESGGNGSGEYRIRQDNDKRSITGPDSAMKHCIYQLPGGNLEWEITLFSRPPDSLISFDISSEGLRFVFQDTALITEHIKTVTDEFPDSTVYSWIAYHSSKKNNRICIGFGGDTTRYNYGSGIAFRIYRPKAFDAAGDTAWCMLDIDTADGKLSIFLPERFLDEADYPVTIDPTIGNSAGGTWFANPSNWALFALYWTHDYPIADGNITKGYVHSYRNNSSYACSLRTYVYDYSSSLSECDLIASSDSIAVTNGITDANAEWNEMSFNSESIGSGVQYFPAFKGYSEANNALRVGYGIGSWGDLKYLTGSNWSAPSTLAGANDDNEAWSCYFEYITSGGPELNLRRRRIIMGEK